MTGEGHGRRSRERDVRVRLRAGRRRYDNDEECGHDTRDKPTHRLVLTSPKRAFKLPAATVPSAIKCPAARNEAPHLAIDHGASAYPHTSLYARAYVCEGLASVEREHRGERFGVRGFVVEPDLRDPVSVEAEDREFASLGATTVALSRPVHDGR